MDKFDMGKFLQEGGVNIDTGNRKQIEEIPIDRIDPDPNNFYQLCGLEELASSIAFVGLQQPLLVRPADDRYVIISGHRRHAALKLLIEQDGREDLRQVPCIVERGEDNPKLAQLKLIYANASTRVLSSAEQAEQAQQVEKLLYQLKEEGMEFPGRMRDYVAKICEISTGKLARLKVIQKNLIPEFDKLWKAGKLRESVAYTLVGHTPVRQKAVWEAQTENGTKEFLCTDGWCENLFRNMDQAERECKKISCDVRENHKCVHVYTRVSRAAGLGQYNSLTCAGCCKSCYNLSSCRFSCGYADAEKQAQKNAEKTKRVQEKSEQKAKDEPKKELLRLAYSRVGQLRKAKEISSKDFVTASLGWHYARDMERLEKMEAGSVTLNDRMPGSIWPDEAKHLCDTADLLGCSIDYLLGRTDCVTVATGQETTPEKCVNIDTGWRTDNPEEPWWYAVLAGFDDEPDAPYTLQKAEWTGDGWEAHGTAFADIGVTVAFWIPMPEE